MVPLSEISDPKNDFNLNLPLYIDSSEPEDIQDIDGHLRGGIPEPDIDALEAYWKVLPGVRVALFKKDRLGYSQLKVPAGEIKSTIFGHREFAAFTESASKLFAKWKSTSLPLLKGIVKGDKPKPLIEKLSEDLLACFEKAPLLDGYDVYQHFMDYWAETMQDDCYLIAADGWVAQPTRVLEKDKKGKTKDKGWVCDLIPKSYVVARYFAKEQAALEAKQAELEVASAALVELEEEHGGEEGFLGALDKIAKPEVSVRLKEIKGDSEAKDEDAALKRWLELSESEAVLKRGVRDADAALDTQAFEKYPELTQAEIKTIVIEDKWIARLDASVQGELDRISQKLAVRIRELVERYATPLPKIVDEIVALTARVDRHLKKMETSRI
jgi:type I restriction enzyme M protein